MIKKLNILKRFRKSDQPAEKNFEKDRERIRRYKSEHKLFLAAIWTVVLHVKLFLKECTENNINALSGQSAFFLILSAVPLLMLFLSVISLIGGKSYEAAAEMAKVTHGVSEAAIQLSEKYGLNAYIYQFLLDAYANASSGIVVITAVTALWSGGKGLYIITDGISRIYRLPQKHTWLLRRVFAMGYTIVLMLMMLLLFGILFLNIAVGQYFEANVDNMHVLASILLGMRNILAMVLISIFLTLALKLYLLRKVNDRRYTKFRVLLPGMIFTSVTWNVLGWGVTLYSKYFTSTMYGNLGSVFIIMMWIYFMMLLLLYGVQIDYVYREQFYAFSFKKTFASIRTSIENQKKAKSKAASK